MTLEQQWQEDVKQFGTLAYLMWDMTEALWLEHNFDCWLRICSREAYRKQSAALPFDLAAALAGDAVEIYSKQLKKWSDFTVDFKQLRTDIDHDFLRMKHPRRVGVDYSQFED